MHRWVYAIVMGFLGAGIVHIGLLLLLPHIADRDAWTRLAQVSEPYAVSRLDKATGDERTLNAKDPATRAVACRFDLSQGAVQISADGNVPLWSASVYDRQGANIYSLNDRSTQGGRMDFVVLSPEQMAKLQAEAVEDVEQSTFVEVPLGEVIVVMRAVVPDATWERSVVRFLDTAACSPR